MAARLEREVVARMPAGIGKLAAVSDAVRDSGVNISGISAWEREGVATFILITDDVARTAETLEALGAEVIRRTALAVDLPDEAGALMQAARMISDAGINIFHAFGTADATAERATVIFKTSDDEAALALFK